MAHPLSKTLCLLTAALPAKTAYLAETAQSVAHAKALAQGCGWSVQWVVVLDGPGDAPGSEACDLLLRMPRQRGISAARNIALTRATGEWVTPLDADDLIDAQGLCAALSFIERPENAHLGWIGANRILLTGARTPHWQDNPRAFSRGSLAEQWSSPFAFHPNSVLLHRSRALAVGGWPAVPVNEDMGLMLLLSEEVDGAFIPDVLTHYRAWGQQEVASDTYLEEKAMVFVTLETQINALRATRSRSLVMAPRPGKAFGTQAQTF